MALAEESTVDLALQIRAVCNLKLQIAKNTRLGIDLDPLYYTFLPFFFLVSNSDGLPIAICRNTMKHLIVYVIVYVASLDSLALGKFFDGVSFCPLTLAESPGYLASHSV